MWFVNRAAQGTFGSQECVAVVFDYGRHGVDQTTKRWKTRAAIDYDSHLAVPWISSASITRIEYSNPSDAYSSWTCS